MPISEHVYNRIRVGTPVTYIGPHVKCFAENKKAIVLGKKASRMYGGVDYRIYLTCNCGFDDWHSAGNFVCEFPDEKLDLKLPITTRAGHRAVIEEVDKSDRPIRARVFLPEGETVLTYPLTGIFYKDVPQPVDLINEGVKS